jgi:hypothetical protein
MAPPCELQSAGSVCRNETRGFAQKLLKGIWEPFNSFAMPRFLSALLAIVPEAQPARRQDLDRHCRAVLASNADGLGGTEQSLKRRKL